MKTMNHIYNKVKAIRSQLCIKHYALCIVAASLFTSCMDLDPKDQLSDSQVWSKADNFQLYANQFYGWTRDFYSKTDYQNGLSDGQHSDLRSDLVCSGTANVYSDGTNTVPAKDGDFTTLYKRIYYCNLLLQNAEGRVDVNTPKGEALFFRAYLYFELLQKYGDAQIITEPLDIENGQLYGSRSNRLDVAKQIIADLEAAQELLPEQPTEDGRVCKYTCMAMISRVALYEGTWQKFHVGNGSNTEESHNLLGKAYSSVRDWIKMSKNPYELFYNATLDKDSYRYMFILEDEECNPAGLVKSANKEYILAHRHRLGDKTGLNITHGWLGYSFLTSKIADMYLCQNGLPIIYNNQTNAQFQGYNTETTEFQNRDNRMDCCFLKNGEEFWDNDGKWRYGDGASATGKTATSHSNSGYLNHKWGSERKVPDYYESYDYPVIRYAEVLLNFAEALYEYKDGISDADLNISINKVRQRSNPNMTPLTNNLVTSNGLSMRDEIRRERTVELFLEGFRIDDLKRWKTAETEMPKDLLGVVYDGTTLQTTWPDPKRSRDAATGRILLYNGRTWAQKNYLYPLPSDQRQLNPNLSQNPGWE